MPASLTLFPLVLAIDRSFAPVDGVPRQVGNVFPPSRPPGPVDWTPWRDEFPIFKRKIYLNTCSLGPLARRVREAQERFFDEWDESGAAAWYSTWMGALDALRGKFAKIVGARKEEVALAPSVSGALSSLASAFDYASRPKVVYSELEFPTVAYQWAVKPRVERVVVPSDDGIRIRPEAFETAIDERTSAVVTSHVCYTSGAIQDIARIAKAAHSHGALAIIDAYQATGQLPTNVNEAGVDVLISGGLKWLLGGTGIAFVYVRRDLIPTLRPTIAGWFGNARQFDFDLDAFEFWPDARRFELGTPANAAVYAASAGLDIVLEIGVDRLRERTTELVRDYVDRVEDAGLEIRTPEREEERAGIVMVKMKEPAKAVRDLAQRGIIVDYRHDRLRASPYFYNSLADNARLVDALRRWKD